MLQRQIGDAASKLSMPSGGLRRTDATAAGGLGRDWPQADPADSDSSTPEPGGRGTLQGDATGRYIIMANP